MIIEFFHSNKRYKPANNCYNKSMKPKPMSQTNPHLKSAAMKRKLVARSVKTSGGVEGIKSSSKPSCIKIHRRDKKIYGRFKPTVVAK
jgi:hypothetical protein